MTHDPLCPWMCDCGEVHNEMQCEQCDLIADVRRDMLAKCIAAVEGQRRFWRDADGTYLQGGEWNEALTTAAHVLRALQDQP